MAYHPTDIIIGQNIKQQRVARGLSQSGLADLLGITFQQVQKYESGANRVGGSRLWDISIALECRVTIFFEGLEQGKDIADMPTLTRSSLELARAINAISDEAVKEQVKRLIKAFAKTEAPANV